MPSVYRKVLELKKKGYLESRSVKGERFSDKTVYAITDTGRKYFHEEMAACASRGATLRERIRTSAADNERYAAEFADIPLVGRTIFDQQRLVYEALLKWLDGLEAALEKEPPDGWKQPDDPV